VTRGELWTLLDSGYASKPRPVVIVQGERGDRFDSVVVCLLTSYPSDDVPTRPRVDPTPANGLEKISFVMTDKLLTVARTVLGERIGELDDSAMAATARGIAELLDIPMSS
jgi:mRNA interferase MazF